MSALQTSTHRRYRISNVPIVESTSAAELNGTNGSTADDEAEASGTRGGASGHYDGRDRQNGGDGGNGEGRDKKRRKLGKKEKGQNKGRQFPVLRESAVKMCRAWELGNECTRGESCKFAHSWDAYFSSKPADIHFELDGALFGEPEYVRPVDRIVGGEDVVGRTLDLATKCPVYADLGYCPFGGRCRFLGGHVRKVDGGATSNDPTRVGEWEILGVKAKEEEGEEGEWKRKETNWPRGNICQRLRNSETPFPFSEKYLAHTEPQKKFTLSQNAPRVGGMSSEEEAMNGEEEVKGDIPGEAEAMDVPLRPEEKKRLNWENGLYLAPLTTVGNLVSHPSGSISLSVAVTDPSHSDACVSPTARPSPSQRWPSPSPWSRGTWTNGRWSADTRAKRCLVFSSRVDIPTGWYLPPR